VGSDAGDDATAAAEPQEYPLAEVDRPLVMYAGMATIDVSVDFATYTQSIATGTGGTMQTRISLGDSRDVDIVGMYSFGSVDVELGGVGSELLAASHLATGDVGAVHLTLSTTVPRGNDHDYGQTLGYTAKVRVVPHRLAAFAYVNATLRELATYPDGGGPMSGSGERLSTSFGAGAQIQLTSRLALIAQPNLVIPVAHHGVPATTTELDAFSELELAFRDWDLYAQFALDDVTNARLPFASAGFVHRW
jgi:hypothetical protein